MELTRDADIDPTPLEGQRIAIIGFGNQGRAQALNLDDGLHPNAKGIDVIVKGILPHVEELIERVKKRQAPTAGK